MVSSKATTVAEYLRSLPPDRRRQIETVRRVILKNLPRGYEEGIQFGMIGYYIPLSRYPDTYNGKPIGPVALASQKQYMALYLLTVYGDPALRQWFTAAFAKAGKKLDMGKSCVRFKSLDDLPLEVIGEVVGKVGVDEFIAHYEKSRSRTGSKKRKAPARSARAASKSAGAAKPTRAPAAASPADRQYQRVVTAFKADAGDGSGRGFGSRGLKVGGTMYAMLSKGTFVVKLPAARVSELAAAGKGQPFDPGGGRLMKEWLAVEGVGAHWLRLAKEARAFVGGGKSKTKSKAKSKK